MELRKNDILAWIINRLADKQDKSPTNEIAVILMLLASVYEKHKEDNEMIKIPDELETIINNIQNEKH